MVSDKCLGLAKENGVRKLQNFSLKTQRLHIKNCIPRKDGHQFGQQYPQLLWSDLWHGRIYLSPYPMIKLLY